MIRLACLLVLAGLLPVSFFLLERDGPSAVGLTFFGMPLAGAGILVFLLARWREWSAGGGRE